MPTPAAGDPAPDFTLDGTHGRFTLSAQRGGRVVLLFYPGDSTPVCTRQFCSYRDRADELAGLDATVVGISSGDVGAKAAFAAEHGLTVPLLADTDHGVARAYGRPTGCSAPAAPSWSWTPTGASPITTSTCSGWTTRRGRPARGPGGGLSYQRACTTVPLCSVETLPRCPQSRKACRSPHEANACRQCSATPAGDA
jgi:peroxiredoxin